MNFDTFVGNLEEMPPHCLQSNEALSPVRCCGHELGVTVSCLGVRCDLSSQHAPLQSHPCLLCQVHETCMWMQLDKEAEWG